MAMIPPRSELDDIVIAWVGPLVVDLRHEERLLSPLMTRKEASYDALLHCKSIT